MYFFVGALCKQTDEQTWQLIESIGHEDVWLKISPHSFAAQLAEQNCNYIFLHPVYFKKISAAPFGNRSLQLRGAWVCTWAVLQILQGGAAPPHKTETRWTEKERFLCLSALLVRAPHFSGLLCLNGLARYSRNYSGCLPLVRLREFLEYWPGRDSSHKVSYFFFRSCWNGVGINGFLQVRLCKGLAEKAVLQFISRMFVPPPAIWYCHVELEAPTLWYIYPGGHCII